jgi:hypothetical protein
MTDCNELEKKQGPMWSNEHQAHFIASFKKDLAEILTNNNYVTQNTGSVCLGADGEILLICIEALRDELIAWCETG